MKLLPSDYTLKLSIDNGYSLQLKIVYKKTIMSIHRQSKTRPEAVQIEENYKKKTKNFEKIEKTNERKSDISQEPGSKSSLK